MPAQPTVRERVIAAHEQHPDASKADLARIVGCTYATVWKALNPDRASEFNRRSNADTERKSRKRAWEQDPENRARCAKCGSAMGAGRRRTRTCMPCTQAQAEQQLLARIDVIREMRNLGLNNIEISYEIGISPTEVSRTAQVARERGLEMPRSPAPPGKDPEVGLRGWVATRARVLRRDNWTCVRGCGRTAEHVHHIRPRSEGGTNDDANLVSLCADCHKIEHGMTPRRVPLEVVRRAA